MYHTSNHTQLSVVDLTSSHLSSVTGTQSRGVESSRRVPSTQVELAGLLGIAAILAVRWREADTAVIEIESNKKQPALRQKTSCYLLNRQSMVYP